MGVGVFVVMENVSAIQTRRCSSWDMDRGVQKEEQGTGKGSEVHGGGEIQRWWMRTKLHSGTLSEPQDAVVSVGKAAETARWLLRMR